jgi:sialate O-acetylesterase
VAAIFRSDMVLQRNATVPVFGTGDVGSTVTVQFQNQNVSTVVGSDGKWLVNLVSMPASTSPSSMVVSATGSSPVTFTGVQVGEVLFFSGQSNMGKPLSYADDSASYIADAANHNIRLFFMAKGMGPEDSSWKVSNSTTAAGFSAVGYWTGYEISTRLNVPVGLIQATYDGTGIGAWQTTNGGTGEDYIAMVKPCQPYAIRAVCWYQGESNGGDLAYATKLTALINEWRTDWGLPNLPFGIVQLPSQKGEVVRWQQFIVSQTVPNTFLAVTHDLPNPETIHPTCKRPVGWRLGIGLRATVYGEAIEYSGPIFVNPPGSYVTGNKVTCTFTHIAGGLITGNGAAPGPFKIADSRGRFQAATGTLLGNTIEVTSGVNPPKKLRYGYSGAGNLYNTVNIPVDGGNNTVTQLPASLFEMPLP